MKKGNSTFVNWTLWMVFVLNLAILIFFPDLVNNIMTWVYLLMEFVGFALAKFVVLPILSEAPKEEKEATHN